MGDWQDNYDNRWGVDPSDYQSEDDFLSARMSSRGDFNSGGKQQEGCYIATCVYGSYECPQVLALRDFRDSKLKPHMLGRAFIRAYYATSPSVVRLLGNKPWFHALCRKPLDAFVAHLSREL